MQQKIVRLETFFTKPSPPRQWTDSMTQFLDMFPCGDISQEEENQTGGKDPKQADQQGGQRQRDADRDLDHLRS